jgi:DNA-binding transcriptional MerR regulator
MKDTTIKRLYYSISEVARLADEEQYVLRYWETEFEQLRPQKNRAGNRIYTPKDIEVIKTIKHLLRDKRYTIEGAKEILKEYRPDTDDIGGDTVTDDITEIGMEASIEAVSGEITLSRSDVVAAITTEHELTTLADNISLSESAFSDPSSPDASSLSTVVAASPLAIPTTLTTLSSVETYAEAAQTRVLPAGALSVSGVSEDSKKYSSLDDSHQLSHQLSRDDLIALRDLLRYVADLLS